MSDEEVKEQMITITVLRVEGKSALIQWLTEGPTYHRAYVPASKVKAGEVSDRVLARGIPYGVAWEKCIHITATPESIANDLRRRGIWRYEDINVSALTKANQAFELGEFMQKAKEASK